MMDIAQWQKQLDEIAAVLQQQQQTSPSREGRMQVAEAAITIKKLEEELAEMLFSSTLLKL